MKNINEEQQFFKQLMDMLESELDDDYEIVLHDLTNDYEHTIVDIRNGYVTGRKVGDCGSNLGLEVLRGTNEDTDRYNYVTKTADKKVLRSSSMYIKDDNGRIIGSLCINKDITFSLSMEEHLHRINKYPVSFNDDISENNNTSEVFVNNVNELLEYFIQEGISLIGKPVSTMKKDDKLKFIKYLDKKGAFIITKSSDRICELLNISRFTFYNYLDQIRTTE